MFGTARDGIKEVPGVPIGEMPKVLRSPSKSTPGINPSAGNPFNPNQAGFHLEPRGGMDTPSVRSEGVTPLGKFAVILLLFALAILFLPKEVRVWFVVIILLGAFVANPGAIAEFRDWVGV